MYMAPIVAAKAPASTPARRIVGAVVLPLSAAVMLPFLAVYALYAGTVLALRAIPKAPRALLDAVDYAGSVALGR
ncbi:hypothetical protein G4G27_19775 [Sphingomonas sp. So64.6b]|uniref:hypothetical protein n=1 Tax=Sphingomonas sp. So64.6b TaxID=2997354 RepID=UPI00160149FF|nr:hypothetical protein [Sphingomonas sp. So64.6b]QNA85972.1 hypothetical protein G4G27_19775 [Sphingomonas sp. So64.6b]